MESRKHLNYNELLSLYSYISKEYTMEYIAELLNCNRSTIYRLIKKHRKYKPGKQKVISKAFKNCVHLNNCKKENKIDKCPDDCPLYKKWSCPKLSKFPFICDFCEKKNTCLRDKYFFNPEEAHMERVIDNKESKTGTHISKSTLNSFSEFIEPLIKNGLSIESIYSSYQESFPVSTRQVRNWVDKKLIENVSRVDLINAQKRDFRPEYNYKRISNNPLIKVNRTYESYLEFKEEYGITDRFELDTIHGKRADKKCILTIHYPRYKFQIGLLLNSCSPDEVLRVMMNIRDLIGKDNYIKLFRVYLADNGFEFDKLYLLENDPDTNEKISRVFYTRPYRSGDKGSCERNHELFRYFITKGQSFEDLTQEKLNFMFSNINSYPRKSLEYKPPYELMSKRFGEDIVKKLGIRFIEFKYLTFKSKNIK